MTGDELKTWMTFHGYTARSLAAALECGEASVWRWRAGRTAIDRRTELALIGLNELDKRDPKRKRRAG